MINTNNKKKESKMTKYICKNTYKREKNGFNNNYNKDIITKKKHAKKLCKIQLCRVSWTQY